MNSASCHSHHSPFGACASFTIGLVGSPGGFAQSISRPQQIRQNAYRGYRTADDAQWNMLPFLSPPQSAASVAVIKRDQVTLRLRPLLALLALFAGFVTSRADTTVSIPRGRAVINAARTTLVADNGQPLRGTCYVSDLAGLQKMKELGLNTVHHYAETFDMKYPAPGSRGPGYNVNEMDEFVRITRELGLYAVFTIGGEAKFHHQWAVDFWKFYAPRYANETHVIYEIQNEPVGWSPPYNSPNANPPGAVAMNVEAYKVIRAAAPNTPVLIFSYSQIHGSGGGKDALGDIAAFNQGVGGDPQHIWSKTAVALHGYAGHQATAGAYRAILAGGYPVINTEFYSFPWGIQTGGQQDIELTGSMEEDGVSWINFLYSPPAPWGHDVTNPLRFKQPIEQAGISWKPDFGTWPAPRAPFGNGGKARDVGIRENGLLKGKSHLEAEEFDTGGEGVAYHDRTPSSNAGGTFRTNEGIDIFADTNNGGAPFVRAEEGEWMDYTIAVREPGDYNLILRYANATAGSILRVKLAGQEILSVPFSGGASEWRTQSQPVFLPYGRAVVRLEMAQGSADLDWFELTPVAEGLVSPGIRKIINRSSGLALVNSSDSSHVMQGTFTNNPSQLWEFKHLGGGQYRITSQANGRLWNRVSFWNSNIDLASWGHDTPDRLQRYLLRTAGDGYYRLAPVDTGFDVVMPSSIDGTPLTQGKTVFTGEASRQWAILPADAVTFPTSLTAHRNNVGQIVLNWRAVPGATTYVVGRSKVSGGPYTFTRLSTNVTTYTDRTAVEDRIGYYTVRSVSANGESQNSVEARPSVVHASYTFDKDGAAILNGVSSARNGTRVGAPLYTTGVNGKALVFDGKDDYATLPTGVVSGLTECSITAWINLDAARRWARLIDFGNDTGTCMFVTPTNGRDTVQFSIMKGGVQHIVTGSKPVPTGRWVHIAAVLRGGVASVYVDGEEVGSSGGWTLTPESLGQTTRNYIGKSQFSADPLLKGRVDGLRIYSTGLSKADIKLLIADDTLPGGSINTFIVPAKS